MVAVMLYNSTSTFEALSLFAYAIPSSRSESNSAVSIYVLGILLKLSARAGELPGKSANLQN